MSAVRVVKDWPTYPTFLNVSIGEVARIFVCPWLIEMSRNLPSVRCISGTQHIPYVQELRRAKFAHEAILTDIETENVAAS